MLRPARSTTNGSIAIMLALLGVAAFHLLGCAGMWGVALRGNDDTVYLYVTALQLFDSERVASAHALAREYLEGLPDADLALTRWNLREAYARNYLLLSSLLYAAGQLLKPFFSAIRSDYGAFLAATVVAAATAATLVSIGALGVALALCRDARFALAALLTVAAIAALALLPTPVEYGAALFDAAGPLDALGYLARLLVNPGVEYSIFGYTPRSTFAFLLLGVFLLRWAGRPAASYWFLAALALVHQSMDGLALALLASVDAILRPRAMTPRVLAPIAAAALAFCLRETLFARIGWGPALVAGLGLAALAAAATLSRLDAARLPRTLARIRSWLLAIGVVLRRRLGRAGADVAVLAMLWLAALPVALIAARGDPLARHAFWGEVHVRLLTMLQPALIAALMLALLTLVARLAPAAALRWVSASVLVAAALLLIPVALGVADAPAGPARLARQMSAYNRFLGRPLPPLDLQVREGALYYAIAASIDVDPAVLRPMLRP